MRYTLTLLAMALACSMAFAGAQTPAGMGAGTTMTSDTESDTYSQTFVKQYYSLSDSDLTALRNQGYSWDQIHMIANAAARTNQPVSRIAQHRTDGMTWSQIADHYAVPAADLTSPYRVRTMTTTTWTASGAGPTTPMYVYDRHGHVILTADDASRYCGMGYDWVDVAVATNISRETHYPTSWLLSEMKTGALTFDTVSERFGVPPSVAYNVTGFPFTHCGQTSGAAAERKMRAIERYQTSEGVLTTPHGRAPGTVTGQPTDMGY